MKNFKITAVVILMAALVFSALSLSAQEPSKEEQEMMAKWMAYATPSEGHKVLEHFAGEWTAAIKMWMKPGAPPMEATGVESAEMILGGRYMKTTFKSNMPGMGDMEGVSIMGYDNSKKIYNHLWVDSSGTGFFPSEGVADAAGKVITLKGLWPDFITGGVTEVKIILTVNGPDNHLMEMFMKGGMYGPNEFKSMEAAYTRKK